MFSGPRMRCTSIITARIPRTPTAPAAVRTFSLKLMWQGPGRLLVLSEVSLGWVFGPRGGQGVAAILHRIRASELEHWSGDEFSLTLSVEELETGERVEGDAMLEYVESRPELEPQVRAFEVSASGSFDWEQFVEPDQEQDEDAARIYKFPEDSRIKIERLPDVEGSYRLLLVAKNQESGEEIMLRGPTLSGLPAHLDLEKTGVGHAWIARDLESCPGRRAMAMAGKRREVRGLRLRPQGREADV